MGSSDACPKLGPFVAWGPIEGDKLPELNYLLFKFLTRFKRLQSFRVVCKYVLPVVAIIEDFSVEKVRPVAPNVEFYFGYNRKFD